MASFISGTIMCFVSLKVVDLRIALAVAIFVAGVQVVVLKVVLVERRPRPTREDPTCTDEGIWKASPTIIVFNSRRFLPGMVSVPTGGIVGAIFCSVGETSFARIMLSVPFAMGVSVILVMAVNRFQDQTPQLIAFFAGTFVWFCVMQWNLMVGLVCGAAVFAVVGSFLEERENKVKVKALEKKWEEEDKKREMRRLRRGMMSSEELEARQGSKDSAGSKSIAPLSRDQKQAMALARIEKGLLAYPAAENCTVMVNGVPKEKIASLTGPEDSFPALQYDSDAHSEAIVLACAVAESETVGLTAMQDHELTTDLRNAGDAAIDVTVVDNDGLAIVEAARIEGGQQMVPTSSAFQRQRQKPSPLDTFSAAGSRPGSKPGTTSNYGSGSGCVQIEQLPLVPAQGQALVDNFRLERHDEDLPAAGSQEPISPALLGWDDPDEAPADDAMLGRWDHGVPKATRTKRRTRAAPVKPSVWGAVKQAPSRKVDTGQLPNPQVQEPSSPSGASVGGRRSHPSSPSGRSPTGQSFGTSLLGHQRTLQASSSARSLSGGGGGGDRFGGTGRR